LEPRESITADVDIFKNRCCIDLKQTVFFRLLIGNRCDDFRCIIGINYGQFKCISGLAAGLIGSRNSNRLFPDMII